MKISYLCVTQDRPEFMPWLLWNFRRQAHSDKELIIVDASERPFATRRKGVRVIAAPGAGHTAMRNIALGEAKGEAITWLDDDDWRHPDSVATLLPLLDEGTPVVGGRVLWFVDLFTGECRRHVERKNLLFLEILVNIEVARSVTFDEAIEHGSDLIWRNELVARYPFAFNYGNPTLLMCHDRNMGNQAADHTFNRPLDELRGLMGEAWGDTDEQLEKLRTRLGNR